jgi:heme oxygenase (biliverdin-IX-beta and delta-forming)
MMGAPKAIYGLAPPRDCLILTLMDPHAPSPLTLTVPEDAPLGAAAAPRLQDPMQALRDGTRHEHERIEDKVPLLRPGLTRESYARYLARVLGYQRPIEHAVARFDLSPLDLRACEKSRLIEADLAALGTSMPIVEARPEDLPPLTSAAEAFGCMYVIEGSTLGGRVILRALTPRLGVHADDGASYLAGYGEATGKHFKAFGDALRAFVAREGGLPCVVAGARATFASFERWVALGEPYHLTAPG